MAYNEQSYRVSTDWWRERLRDYREQDAMSFEQFKRSFFCFASHMLDTMEFIHENNQPERLNEKDHIVKTNDMICDSLNTANK